MPIKKAEQPAIHSAEHLVAQQAQYLSNKYQGMFRDQSNANGDRHLYGYPPVKSLQEQEMRALEENAAKGGHGVPLSSELHACVYIHKGRHMQGQREGGIQCSSIS